VGGTASSKIVVWGCGVGRRVRWYRRARNEGEARFAESLGGFSTDERNVNYRARSQGWENNEWSGHEQVPYVGLGFPASMGGQEDLPHIGRLTNQDMRVRTGEMAVGKVSYKGSSKATCRAAPSLWATGLCGDGPEPSGVGED